MSTRSISTKAGRPKRAPVPKGAVAEPLIALRGTPEQRDWLRDVNRKTHIPKAAIIRLALDHWGVANGHPPFPKLAGEDQ